MSVDDPLIRAHAKAIWSVISVKLLHRHAANPSASGENVDEMQLKKRSSVNTSSSAFWTETGKWKVAVWPENPPFFSTHWISHQILKASVLHSYDGKSSFWEWGCDAGNHSAVLTHKKH